MAAYWVDIREVAYCLRGHSIRILNLSDNVRLVYFRKISRVHLYDLRINVEWVEALLYISF